MCPMGQFNCKVWVFVLIFVFSLLHAITDASAVPCVEKQLETAAIELSVFRDCGDDSLLYFVPKELSIVEKGFDGSRSFVWRETPEGGAKVAMDLQLFHSDAAILRTLRDVKQRFPRKYRMAPFEVRNMSLEGFGGTEDGVVEQKFTTTAGFSTDRFKFYLELNKDGVSLWKDNTDMGLFIVQGATLHYEVRMQRDGADDWRRVSTTLNLESIPSCILGNTPCTERDRNETLVKKGALFGERYFHMQFVQCGDFLSATSFNTPAIGEVSENHLSTTDIEIVYNAALRAYQSAMETQKRDCAPQIDDSRGYEWMMSLGRENRISCQSINQWPWSKVYVLLPLGSSSQYADGVRRAYDELAKSGNCFQTISCDYRPSTGSDSRCKARFASPTQLCYLGDDLKSFITLTTGECRFHAYRWTTEYDARGEFIENWVEVVKKDPAAAVVGETCVNMKIPVDETVVMGRVICRGQ